MTSYTANNQFSPDWVAAPGETVLEIINDLGWTQVALAQRLGRTPHFVNQLVKGKALLDKDTALRLENVLGTRAGFWLSLENDYQLYQARKAEEEKLAEQEAWAGKFPMADMCKLGWTTKRNTKGGIVKELLEFFAVASPEAWLEVWSGMRLNVSYRGSTAFTPKGSSVAAWLRYGQKKAVTAVLPEFTRSSFSAAVPDLRELTNNDNPAAFVPKLQEICASCGVLVLFIPELPGTTLSGAAHWYNSIPIIQLSLRYKTNDHLWFSFFHEMKHILSHSAKKIYINERDNKSGEEAEANEFAANTLIPPRSYERFLATWNGNILQIKQFALKMQIAPGIVVGRLQHDSRLPITNGNKLKIRYQWA